MVIFILLLMPTIFSTYTLFNQTKAYTEIIDNIAYANRLNTDVNSKIEPVIWNIVAGKVKFEESEIIPLISDIRTRLYYIQKNTYSVESSGTIELSLRALGTIEDYVEMLGKQIDNRGPVKDNEYLLEQIRACVALINDWLQEFSSNQLEEVAALNEKMSIQSNRYFIISIALIVIVILTGIFSFLYIYKSIMNPIKVLCEMSAGISEGNFGLRVDLIASQEFNELASGMNKMSGQIELLLEKSVEEQKNIRMLEAKTLQAQITPHFLYNTLDAIIWAAEDGNMLDVIKLVTSLSSFFRISLSHGIDFIPVSNEIAHVRSYLTIQQMRYSDILTYEISVDDGLDNCLILKLLLQPLVENALYHGIKNIRGRGKIEILAARTEGGVKFSVSDNGIGIPPEKLDAIKAGIEDENGGAVGYGLFNVNKRIKLYYDTSNGIEIKSEYKKGTEVSFILNI